MLCTSGYMDDVTFRHNGRDAKTWRLHDAGMAISGVVIPGRGLMSVNACSLHMPIGMSGIYRLLFFCFVFVFFLFIYLQNFGNGYLGHG